MPQGIPIAPDPNITMGDQEETQEQMKANMLALKEQMASMMEAMLGMRQLMENNVATAAAVSSAAVASLNNDWFNSNKLNSRNQGNFFFFSLSLSFFFHTIIHFTVIKFRRKIITIES